MTEPSRKVAKVRVSDKRGRHKDSGRGDVASDVAPRKEARPEPPVESEPSTADKQDYLDDLRRLQAEFDNYRKRMMREQTTVAGRAGARLVERLLPVLDSFDRALVHSKDGDGVELLRKELVGVLEAEGLEVIPADGHPFNPHLHEAVESHEDPGVSEPVVTDVYRTGYKLAGQVLRPAMVVVARPLDEPESSHDEDAEGAPAVSESAE